MSDKPLTVTITLATGDALELMQMLGMLSLALPNDTGRLAERLGQSISAHVMPQIPAADIAKFIVDKLTAKKPAAHSEFPEVIGDET